MIKYILNIGKIARKILVVLWEHREVIVSALAAAEKATSSTAKKEKIASSRVAVEEAIEVLEELKVGK